MHPFDLESGNLQALQNAPEHYPKLMKILIPRSTFKGIRYHLDRCGINAAVVYPDLDGLARHIEWLYRAGYKATEHAIDNLEPRRSDQAPRQGIDSGGKSGLEYSNPEEEGPIGKTGYPVEGD
ncbi:MAG TPA: hypothetical protein VN493_16355 [Thermoanaerobaculia bacterium]|nr:hypothetical protein [Thermoanaerobaculia bacterium]